MAIASGTVTSSNTAVATPARVLGVQYRAGATAGTVVLKDGGSSGTVKLTIYTPASAAHAGFVPVDRGGIVFATDVYAALTQADGCTVIYSTVP